MRYKTFIIKKFVGSMIKRGKKQKALNFLINSFSFLKGQEKQKPRDNIAKIFEIVKPVVSFTRLRRGNKIFYLPKLLSLEDQYKQGLGWIIEFSRLKRGKGFQSSLNKELSDILKRKGESMNEKKKVYSWLLDSRPYLYLLKWN